MASKKAPTKSPGLATMHQGSTRRGGDAKMAGNTRGIMKQGTTKRRKAPVGKLGDIMGQ